MAYIITVLIISLVYFAMFWVLEQFGVSSDHNLRVSGIVFTMTTKVYEIVAIQYKKTFNIDDNNVKSYEDFGYHGFYYVMMGFFTLTGVGLFVGGVSGSLVMLSGMGFEKLLYFAGVLSFAVIYPACYFVGRWIGMSCRKNCFIVAVASLVLSRILLSVLDYFVMTQDVFISIYQCEKTLYNMIIMCFSGVAMYMLFGSIGYFCGRRQRRIFYIKYLFSKISDESKREIIDLSYEEARSSNSKQP